MNIITVCCILHNAIEFSGVARAGVTQCGKVTVSPLQMLCRLNGGTGSGVFRNLERGATLAATKIYDLFWEAHLTTNLANLATFLLTFSNSHP
jgi:hypothetical protein